MRPSVLHQPVVISHPPRRRAGFTVVEVLVALMVVSVGLLGVAGVSARALRAANAATRERVAITRARTRLALLAAAGCAGAADGEIRNGGRVVERWSVGPILNTVRLVETRTEWDDSRHRRVLVLADALLC